MVTSISCQQFKVIKNLNKVQIILISEQHIERNNFE
jgi:hypothetical protein